jgi:hypothetical protein
VGAVTLEEKISCKKLTFTLLAMHATEASQTPRNPCPPIKQTINKIKDVVSREKTMLKADPKNQKVKKNTIF